MGNTSGYGVLNLSTHSDVSFGLSAGATHFYENGVQHGQIFYRSTTGAYTIYAQVGKDISDATGWKEAGTIAAVTTGAVVGAGVAGAALVAAPPVAAAIAGGSTSFATAAVGGSVAVGGTIAGGAASGALTTYGVAQLVFDEAKLCAEEKWNSGAGSGAWYVLTGGALKDHNGNVGACALKLRKATPEFVVSHGAFTELSKPKFYTSTDNEKKYPPQSAHKCLPQCTTDCGL